MRPGQCRARNLKPTYLLVLHPTFIARQTYFPPYHPKLNISANLPLFCTPLARRFLLCTVLQSVSNRTTSDMGNPYLFPRFRTRPATFCCNTRSRTRFDSHFQSRVMGLAGCFRESARRGRRAASLDGVVDLVTSPRLVAADDGVLECSIVCKHVVAYGSLPVECANVAVKWEDDNSLYSEAVPVWERAHVSLRGLPSKPRSRVIKLNLPSAVSRPFLSCTTVGWVDGRKPMHRHRFVAPRPMIADVREAARNFQTVHRCRDRSRF